MEIAAMKERSRLRMSEYQKELEIESEDSQNTCSIANINLQTLSSCNSLSQTASPESMLQHESDLNSLLLPMFGPLPEGASVTIKGIDNPFEKHRGEVAVKKYISKLVEDRDVAMATAQSYRNRMEVLEVENQKLTCEMHSRVQRIRTFWRNKVAEGGTRAGKCVKKALNMCK